MRKAWFWLKAHFTCHEATICLLFLVCLGGFVWITHGEVEKFFENRTSVAKSYEFDDHGFPDIIFCATKGFRDVNTKVSIAKLTQEEYDNISIPFEVDLVGLDGGDGQRTLNYSTFDLYTMYNGKCKVFKIKDNIGAKKYPKFKLSKNQEYSVMVTLKDEYIFAIEQQWLDTPPTVINVNADTMIEFERATYVGLSQGERKCQKNENTSTFVECFKEELVNQYHEKKMDCLPILFEKVLTPLLNKTRPCDVNDDPEKMMAFYEYFRDGLLSYGNQGKKRICTKPCQTDIYELKAIKLHVLDKDLEKNLVYIASASDYYPFSQEYVVNDPTSFASSIGGGIGIFLGYSFFGVLSKLTSTIYHRCMSSTE